MIFISYLEIANTQDEEYNPKRYNRTIDDLYKASVKGNPILDVLAKTETTLEVPGFNYPHHKQEEPYGVTRYHSISLEIDIAENAKLTPTSTFSLDVR